MTYSSVRSETHAARDWLVLGLSRNAGVVDIWHDGSDLVVARLASSERVQIMLVDSVISLHEIQTIIAGQQAKGFYTLMMFWADLLLPADGERFAPQDWMAALLALYGDKIYGYEADSQQAYLFPVYFRPQIGYAPRLIHWGKTIRARDLQIESLMIESPHFKGRYRIAHFEPAAPIRDSTAQDERASDYEPPVFANRTAFSHYYTVLGISLTATAEEIRHAYHELARVHHPDLNPDPAATERMQQINFAYTQIMSQWGE